MINRIQTIDAIRGFALFGIFIVNILAFSSVYFGTGISPPDGLSFVDRVLAFTVSALFELKFYLLFSFLFGYSVTLQMQSAERAGTGFMPRMIRRQIGLFIIGALHAIFLFHGDILTTYALLGMILIMVRNWPNKTLLSLAIGLIVLTALIWMWIAFEQYRQPDLDQTIEANTLLASMINTWRGTPIQIIGQHIASFSDFMPLLLLLQAPCAFALFLIGFVVGRARLFERPDIYRPYLSHSALIGLIIGLPGGLIYAGMTQFMAGTTIETIGLALSILTATFLTLSLITVLVMFFNLDGFGWLRNAFVNAGRMALTNYLLQSLIAAMIFHGYGLGLIDQLSIAQVLSLAILIFSMQLVFNTCWMKRFRYGPIEYILRAITILQWPNQARATEPELKKTN